MMIEELSSEEVDKYVRGIQLGYDFAVSALSTVQYMRSPFRTFNKFIKNTKHTDTLPVRTKSQQERLVALVSGEVYVEPILNPMIYPAETR
ncbi:MAG: hypothetical protein U5K77_00245 [Candidatus Saccharibacteria bacterium]|nr:hypothetical protein [Candidatus Saccharibacteria bacterium]